MPQNEIFKTPQEEVYKSALEIILALCDSYSTTTSDIKSVCKTVLKIKKGNKDE
jgi:hypothetical protein